MHLTILHFLFLIPVGLALAFLLWVLRSVTEQLSSRRNSTEKQPLISILVRDQQTMRGLPARAETAPRPMGNLETGTKQASIPTARYTPAPIASTLGIRSRA